MGWDQEYHKHADLVNIRWEMDLFTATSFLGLSFQAKAGLGYFQLGLCPRGNR